MSLPTLDELGIVDKRKKISDEIKSKIKDELNNTSGKCNITALARKYGVSICTVRMIRNPEHEKALIHKSRKNKQYNNKEKQKVWRKDLHARKMRRIHELLEEKRKERSTHISGDNGKPVCNA